MERDNTKSVAIIGAGLVGATAAIYMAKRGYKVDVFEKREDPRSIEHVKGRSINLLLSTRGKEALKYVDVESEVLKYAIPLYGRMVHRPDGQQQSIPYGRNRVHMDAIRRQSFVEVIISAAESFPNVSLHFSHKLTQWDVETNEVLAERDDGSCYHHKADLILGCDGVNSTVRALMMTEIRMNFQQNYCVHHIMEFIVPATSDNQHVMDTNHIHLWPRDDMLMVGFPNIDKTFTTILLMKLEMFQEIHTDEDLMRLFGDHFADVIPLLGEGNLKKSFFDAKPQHLKWIKCCPYHIDNKVLLLGDAAHAMVPFYGQGINSGLEDCLILNELLDKHNDDMGKALHEFTDYRSVDAHAMSDLSLDNYIAVLHLVKTRFFSVRKTIDNMLNWLFPRKWIPLYNNVSFTRTRYHTCIRDRHWQENVLTAILLSAAALGCAPILWISWYN